MKLKIRLLGLLLTVAMLFAACEGQPGLPGRNGEDGESTQWFVQDYDVLSSQWRPAEESGDGYYFKCFEYEVRVPQLTEFVFDKGYVGCYLVWDIIREDGKKYTYQRPLPYTIYGIDNGFAYSENYSFEIRPQYVKFIVKYSDFGDIEPLSCIFTVRMMW